MEKEVLLIKLLDTAGGIRRELHAKEPPHHKTTPILQNVLCLLLKKGSMNQRTIAKNIGVSGQAISELMKKMQEENLIKRVSGEFNNENIISLTEEGIMSAKDAQIKIEQFGAKFFKNFTSDEICNLFFLLEKIQKEFDLN